MKKLFLFPHPHTRNTFLWWTLMLAMPSLMCWISKDFYRVECNDTKANMRCQINIVLQTDHVCMFVCHIIRCMKMCTAI